MQATNSRQQFYNIDNQMQAATINNIALLLPSSRSCSCTTTIHVNSCIHLLLYMRSYVIHVRILCKNVCIIKTKNSIDSIKPARSETMVMLKASKLEVQVRCELLLTETHFLNFIRIQILISSEKF